MNTVRLRPRSEITYIGENRTVMGIGPGGVISEDTKAGLFVDETRILSRYEYFANGRPPRLVVASAIDPRSWLGYFIFPPYHSEGDERGAPPQHAVEMRVLRVVSEGVTEAVTFRNFTQRPVSFEFSIGVAADFRDISELESGERLFSPVISEHMGRAPDGALQLSFVGSDERRDPHALRDGTCARLERALHMSVRAETSEVHASGRELLLHVDLAPQGSASACIEMGAQIEDMSLRPNAVGVRGRGDESQIQAACTEFSTPGTGTLSQVVVTALARARDDLWSLRLYCRDRAPDAWVPAAGLPIFLALFGRDSLTAAWQSALLTPQMLRGTLPVLVRYQGTRDDPWRDEQPGKLLHQARNGPLSHLNILPWGRNYASVTPSAFLPVALGEAFHWTGDRALVGPLLPAALRALRWYDEHGDLDGDGLYEYQGRSTHGQKNQAWKDSDEAIVHADGSQAYTPLGTCEQHAFVYSAKLHMAELLLWFERRDEASALLREAQALKRRFNDRFWMADEAYFALGIDRDKRQIRSIASNPGHCVAAGIVDDALVRPTASRLLSDELFSGWGVRTLSARHPAYNPYAYQRGTVWPVEQGTFALGFMRYGLHAELHRLTRALFESCALFDLYRLPECFGGQPRNSEHPFPSLYPQANWPQAWSCSALFSAVQALLGIYPYAPLSILLVDPHLPDWLPELTLSNLRVGKARVSLRFVREPNGATRFEVLEKHGRLYVLRQPSPFSLTASLGERLRDLLHSSLR